jgi:hypothetical protein|tara:strand:- start:306 stop:581 length:276 start_codon:yes stop_codon:yes gene_type:complete
MTLLEKYNANISPLAGPQNPTTPIGATDQSKLHDQYSINGNPNVKNKPQPSTLDLNGISPLGALSDPSVIPLNNTFKKGTYKNNLPLGASF